GQIQKAADGRRIRRRGGKPRSERIGKLTEAEQCRGPRDEVGDERTEVGVRNGLHKEGTDSIARSAVLRTSSRKRQNGERHGPASGSGASSLLRRVALSRRWANSSRQKRSTKAGCLRSEGGCPAKTVCRMSSCSWAGRRFQMRCHTACALAFAARSRRSSCSR